ncbi:hypothetical protein KL918_000549 [Ogataea parapolymorpha]|uniref:DNA replication regulator SLD2 n=1 Tax=Ogataea parapolymorpha (strain ATCC 26012 / BCRC 20466 / JCM 22074 / NRRL Y-7560 / DL-1) TaxID=871575 RepID=W1Q998_OGAPD|nr:hypothetical protein HPODL_05371 [Ogataea parapolymorpha DL-1]ESW96591.1 hypothetical protein HPODL_05371 [Ogataea parapolymorpha DL-1]KAG7870345.1 hypothetical protein KL918_000549 [Ogataea parapolymorpha]KAG7875294.1 hypothetical protein KL916_000906 [Ogataea parapolymorpha]
MEINKLERYVSTLKREIKHWEHKYEAENGKMPTTDVIKADLAVSARYKKYHKYKKILGKLQSGALTVEQWKNQERPSQNAEQNLPRSPPPSSPESEKEIGPTPQLDGRVLGIFDIEIKESPTRQTPTKQANPVIEVASPDKFKTPTKKVERKLLFQETPRRERTALLQETPQYLRTESSTSSAMFYGNLTPEKKSPQVMDVSPSKVVEPSPIIRRAGRRTLYELNNEIKELQRQQSQDGEEFIEEVHEELPEDEIKQEDVIIRKKTAKRTTRRVKLRTLGPQDEQDMLESLDIHEEIRKLRQKSETKTISEDESVSESESEEEEYVRKKATDEDKKSTTGKHPLSNNFVRMKIHRKTGGRFKRRR